jgi:hypothetical protein
MQIYLELSTDKGWWLDQYIAQYLLYWLE